MQRVNRVDESNPLVAFLTDIAGEASKPIARAVYHLKELVGQFYKVTNLHLLHVFKNQLVVSKASDAATCVYLYEHVWTAQERVQKSVTTSLERLNLAELKQKPHVVIIDAVLVAINSGLSRTTMCDLLFGAWIELVASKAFSGLFAQMSELPELKGNPDAQNLAFINNTSSLTFWLVRVKLPLSDLVNKVPTRIGDNLLVRINAALELTNKESLNVMCKRLRSGLVLCDRDRVSVRLPLDEPRELHGPLGVACRRKRSLYHRLTREKPTRAECFVGPLRSSCAIVAGQVLCPQDVLILYKVPIKHVAQDPSLVECPLRFAAMLNVEHRGGVDAERVQCARDEFESFTLPRD